VHGPRELDVASLAGADAWVDKLADFGEILAAIRALLDGRR
jgi:DNA-binding response OmpR family regulator